MDTNNTYADVAIDSLLNIAESTVDSLRAHVHPGISLGVVDLLEALAAKTRPLLVADALDPAILQRPPIAVVLSGTDEYGAERRTEILDAVEQLQLEGYVVLQHSFDAGLDDEDKQMMGDLLRHKIDMADVVNVYNGDDIYDVVLPFIEYAENTSTPVLYSENDR